MQEKFMTLSANEQTLLNGCKNKAEAKVMQTMLEFARAFGAEKLVDITAPVHVVTSSMGGILLKPLYDIMAELIENGVVTKEKFTVDPHPYDHVNIPCSKEEREAFDELYSIQGAYEELLVKVGLKDNNAYTCICYADEVGNTPKYGDILSWAESSAVIYANSVLGARSNRNSGIMEMFGGIIGKVPYYGLLTDEGRKATWIIDVRTSSIPEAQILGSAIGMKVVEDVPYIIGLDKFLGQELDSFNKGYLKDMGAACASNGAVGLFHVENLTPEAKKHGKEILSEKHQVYVIDDLELERIYKSYPLMWSDKDAEPVFCYIGCPHVDYGQLVSWTKQIDAELHKNGRDKVCMPTVIASAPDIIDKFKKTSDYKTLMDSGVILSEVCPLMYVNNPLIDAKPNITNSNKLRTYSNARYYKDHEILSMICGGE